MRKELEKIEDVRLTIQGKVNKFSTRSNRWFTDITVLLTDIINVKTGKKLTDHLWFVCGKWSSNIKENDSIQLDARVKPYLKGYGSWDEKNLDYKLSNPSKVKILNRNHESNK